jgi:hypothetical protein
MKASSTAARSHGPADPGSFDAVPATTLRLRSALRPSAPSSPPADPMAVGPQRSASTAANPSDGARPGRPSRSGRCSSAARNATCDRTAARGCDAVRQVASQF